MTPLGPLPTPCARLRRLAAPLLMLLAIACASHRDVGETERIAPRPYTAEEIRAGHPAGLELVFRVEQPGAPTVLQRMRFVHADADGAVYESSQTDLHGAALGPVESQRATWVELRDHATYPAGRTELTEESCAVEAGTYECWRYAVDETEEGGPPARTSYWFAKSKPGPPVLIVTEAGGEVVFRMELVELQRT